MNIAITTRTLPATDRRGCRIVASSPTRPYNRKVTRGYDHAASFYENHAAAARAYFDQHLAAGAKTPQLIVSAETSTSAYVHVYGY